MSKICIWGDVHLSTYSSILRKRGQKFSLRLENCIQSINWVEQLSQNLRCDLTVCLGDFFDQAELTAEEITALNDISWNDIHKYFIVGNHEMSRSTLSMSTAHLFKLIPNVHVIDKPLCPSCISDADLFFIPYILEENRKPLIEYMKKSDFRRYTGKQIVFSHNDISGIQMGKFISKQGFLISEIEDNCDLFLNGHIHNGSQISKKIINVGNLTGQNFSEDAFMYDHVALILDTNTLQCDVYENPYAVNFYKIEDINTVDLSTLKNAVLTVRCKQSECDTVRCKLDLCENILEYRLLVQPEFSICEDRSIETFSIDHLSEFYNYCVKQLGSDPVVVDELNYLCR